MHRLAIAVTIALAACSVKSITFTPGEDGGMTDGVVSGPAAPTITVTRSGAATGEVSARGAAIACGETCSATVVAGTVVTLTATAGPGSVFGGWSGGGCAASDPSCTLTVTEDTTVAARFDLISFTVEVGLVGNGAGVVTSTPEGLACPGACTMLVPYNTRILLDARPTGISTFTGWGGRCTGPGVCAFTVTSDTTVMAGFAAHNDLIVMRAGNGTGTVTSSPTGIECGSVCAQGYPLGTGVTLTAAAAADSTFVGWSDASCPGTGECRIIINQAATVTATFVLKQRTLQVRRNGAGSGTMRSSNVGGIECGTDCTEDYDIHTVVTLTAQADPDSLFLGWSDGGGADSTCSGAGVCTVAVDDAVLVTASFGLRTFVLSVARMGTGTGSVRSTTDNGIDCGTRCSAEYVAHTVVELAPTAEPGSTFTGWGGACSGTGPCEIPMLSTASVTATFSLPGQLVMINESTNRVERLDPITRVVTDVGPLGVPYFLGDCAWNPADSTLYVVDGRTSNTLYRVNLMTGAASVVGVHGITDMFALAYHPPSNKLYGIGRDASNVLNLYTVSTVNGAATRVGPTGPVNQTFVDGLAWDSKRNELIALTAGATTAFRVDVSTGALTAPRSAGSTNDHGMTYHPVLDRFLVVDFSGRFLQLDPDSFARTDFPSLSGSHTCVAFIP